MVDLVKPDGSPADPSWLTDVDDSAPEPDLDLEEDSVSVSNPDGSQTDPSWLGDVDDSAPEPDPEWSFESGADDNTGWLAGLGIGALGLLLGLVALIVGGD